MAICKWCESDMSDPKTVTCTGNYYVDFPDGRRLGSLQFRAPKPLTEEQWMDRWREIVLRDNSDDDTEGDARRRMAKYMARKDRCPDCNVKDGGRHHPGCDKEECPRCGGQLIGCGCLA